MDKTRDISWIIKKHDVKNLTTSKKFFPVEAACTARKFHRQIPDYRMTRLAALPHLADMLGIGQIWVKDEGQRLELNSFKVLGGSFAIYRYLQNLLNMSDDKLTYDYLISKEAHERTGKLVFASATDGNHGRGIAWAARKLGHDCHIYVHKETSQARIDAIASYGATVKIIDGNYDDAVRQIEVDAKKNGWIVISDTSWPGYEQVPTWIMQGYTSMILETQAQLSGSGVVKPTHVFVQAGVGALAASVIGFYHTLFGQDAPKCIVVEPENAACIYETAKYSDGHVHNVTGDLDTIMAGLACGEPSPIAWSVLKETADAFIKVPDYVAARGMRILATPLKDDPFIISGESGAVTLGALYSLLTEEGTSELKDFLQLNKDSQVLFINTEGNTDPRKFRQIIWDGVDAVPKNFLTQK